MKTIDATPFTQALDALQYRTIADIDDDVVTGLGLGARADDGIFELQARGGGGERHGRFLVSDGASVAPGSIRLHLPDMRKAGDARLAE